MSRQIALGSLLGVALLGLSAAPPLVAQGPGGEDLEGFRRQLADYVERLRKLPPTTLNAIYDQPGSLADAAQRVDSLSPEQLRVLSSALKTVPQWETLPDVLAAVKGGRADPAPGQAQAFREQWLQILSQCQQIPPTMVSPTFHLKVKRLQSLLNGLTPEQVSLFQVKMVEALPGLTAALQGSGPPGPRVSASCERNCDNSFPDGILCQVQEILCEVGTFPSRIADFAGSAVATIVQGIKDLLGKITSFIPRNAEDVLNLVPQLRQPDWYLAVANLPRLAPPCPPDGTPFLGGSMGTVEGAAVFKRVIWWPVKQVYDILPDDIFGAAGKIPVALLLYYPVDYLNMCFAEAWQVKDRDLLDAHEQLEQSKVDVNIASRASQLTINRAVGRLFDVPGGLFAADARIAGQLDVLEGKLDTLGSGGSDDVAFVREFRKLNLRLRMENDLLGEEDRRLALFYLPRAVGGFIEDVREIVVELIQKMDELEAGHVVHARRHLAKGDLYYARGLYRSAYDRYREAYEHLGHSREPNCKHGHGD